MAEVLVQFDRPVSDGEGREYTARVCGRAAEDGLWEGWVEFEPAHGGPTLRSPRETDQPDRGALEYWATGLTLTYLEGALQRARHPETPDLRPRPVEARPAFDGPANPAPPRSAGETPVLRPRAVLDPFAVYRQGEEVLRQELRALDDGKLRSIVRAHALLGEGEVDLEVMGRTALADLIVAAVRKRAG